MTVLNRVKSFKAEHSKGETSIVIYDTQGSVYFGAVVYQKSHLISPVRLLALDIEYVAGNSEEDVLAKSLLWFKNNISTEEPKLTEINLIKTTRLAMELGISNQELHCLSWDTDSNESSDGQIYDYIITFDKNNPREVLNKISGLSDGNTIRVSVNAFDEQEPS